MGGAMNARDELAAILREAADAAFTPHAPRTPASGGRAAEDPRNSPLMGVPARPLPGMGRKDQLLVQRRCAATDGAADQVRVPLFQVVGLRIPSGADPVTETRCA